MDIKPNKVRFFASTYEELLKNASIVPRNKYICFSVFEAKNRMDSYVLSHNSAKPTTINGINRSYAVIYVFDSDKLIGLGRALCEGEYQAAISIYGVVLLPEYQGKCIGGGGKLWKHYANNEIHVA